MAEPAETPLSAHEDLHLARNCLDALASGACDEATFLQTAPEIARRTPDAGWDLLSLLDQYYRRGKIPQELFTTVKHRLQAELLGPALEIDISLPMPLREEPLGARTQPIPAASGAAPAALLTAPAAAAPAAAATAGAAGGAAAAAAAGAVAAAAAVASDPAPATDKIPLSAPATPAVAAREPEFQAPSPASSRETARGDLPPAVAPRREPRVGDVLRGRYLLQNLIGRGGMGSVFEAIDQFKLDLPNADRRIAVKVMNSSVRDRPELLAELRREFQNLQNLAHPNIVRAFEYDRDGEISFFTMEFLSGLSLSRVLAARQELPLDQSHAFAIVRDTGAALAYAHARGIVHGDLNTSNVFVTDEGEVRVLDFGGARLAPSETGLATPRYASCQVLEGQLADTRDDLYSLACVTYLLLTGHHPFGERTAIEARSARARPRRPAGLPAAAWHALRSALTFDRERRPPDVAEWLKSFDFRPAVNRLPPLLVLLRLPPHPARRSGSAGVFVVMLLAVGTVGAWIIRHPEVLPGNLDAVRRHVADLGAGLHPLLVRDREQLAHATGTDAVSPAERVVQDPPSAPSPAPATAASAAPVPPPEARPAPRAPTVAVAPSAPPAPVAAHPRTRIEFAASTIDVPPSEPAALVLVRRSGNRRGDASFTWWTESGTAKPGEDFAPIAPHVEHFEDGETSMRLSIPLSGEGNRHQERSFYVVLGDPGDGVTIGDRSLAMVTLPPSDSSAEPSTVIGDRPR